MRKPVGPASTLLTARKPVQPAGSVPAGEICERHGARRQRQSVRKVHKFTFGEEILRFKSSHLQSSIHRSLFQHISGPEQLVNARLMPLNEGYLTSSNSQSSPSVDVCSYLIFWSLLVSIFNGEILHGEMKYLERVQDCRCQLRNSAACARWHLPASSCHQDRI